MPPITSAVQPGQLLPDSSPIEEKNATAKDKRDGAVRKQVTLTAVIRERLAAKSNRPEREASRWVKTLFDSPAEAATSL
jgi:hypothetical protein